MSSFRACFAAATLCAASLNVAASCGAAFCLVNTDWSAQGAWTEPGVRFDLRYESIDLDQPRSGTDRVEVGEIRRHHDEVVTRNRNLVGAVDWSLAPLWGISLTLPYVDRHHEHIHNHHGEKVLETWDFRELGDMRALVRREMGASHDDPANMNSWGLVAGLKLPTGKYDVTNADGDEAERSLQPGTGTTDLLVGAYWNGMAPLADTSWFARAQAAFALAERAGYKPGNTLQVDAGVRYAPRHDVGLMLQANYLAKGRDSGVNAEPEDSGQRQLWLSPGVSWNVGKTLQLYAFAQFAVYQSVNGVQLTADRSYSAGLGWRF